MWVLEGIGIVLAVWLFQIVMEWLGDMGQHLTPEQARRHLLKMRARKRLPGSPAD